MSRSRWAAVAAVAWCVALSGCGGAAVAPVKGKVTFKGKPLEFGGVMFQPLGGQPARGTIGPDGSFTLTTFAPNDGAVIGSHQVRVTCYEGQKPGAALGGGEGSLGKSLIPEKYSNFASSGLTFEVKAGANDAVFDLADAPAGSNTPAVNEP